MIDKTNRAFIIRYVEVARIFVVAFILYIIWYADAYQVIPGVLYGTSFFAIIFVLFDMMKSRLDFRTGYYSIIPILFVYGIYSVISGLVVVPLYGGSIASWFSSMVTYFAFLGICFAVCYISVVLKDIEWLRKVLLFTASICAVQAIFMGKLVRSGMNYVTTMGDGNNPNSLGFIMVIGIFCVIMRREYRKRLLLSSFMAGTFLYVIVLSGSRKCLIAGVMMVFLWMMINIYCQISEGITSRTLVHLFVFVIIVFIALQYLKYSFGDTIAFKRFENVSSAVNDRWILYVRAWELWKESPILGVGFRQYEIISRSGIYSHSTYAEILSCSGVFGIGIWTVFFTRKMRLAFLSEFRKFDMYRFLVFLLMIFIELYMGLGQIWFYEISHLLVLTLLFLMPELYG